MFRVKLPEC